MMMAVYISMALYTLRVLGHIDRKNVAFRTLIYCLVTILQQAMPCHARNQSIGEFC